MKKHTSINSLRVMSVIDDTIDRLNFLDAVAPDILMHTNNFSEKLGEEVSAILLDQR